MRTRLPANTSRLVFGPDWGWLLLVSGVLLIARVLFVNYGPLDLAPDEAQYWDWTRQLAWSYTTKPPLTTWLLALSTQLLGDTYLGVRFFALLGQVLVPLLGYAIAQQLAGAAAARWAFVLLTCTPLLLLGGLIMSPDVPSLVCWLGALLLLTRVDWHKPINWPTNWPQWLGIGLLIGLGGLAKPTVGVFYPLLGLYLLVYQRAWLWRPQVYVAGVVSVLVLTPVWYWNATHDWAMFAHVLDQTDNDGRWGGLKSFADFLGGQLLVVGLLSFPLLLWAAGRSRTPALVWVFSIPLLAVFVGWSFFSKIQANWPILAVITGLILLACHVPHAPKVVRTLLALGLGVNVFLAGLLHDTFSLRALGIPLAIQHDPTKVMLGWRQLGAQLAEQLAQDPRPVLTTRYQTTAGLAFHTPGQPQIWYLNPGWRRENHYDWQIPPATGPIYYVTEQVQTLPAAVTNRYGPCTKVRDLVATRQGLILRRAGVWGCEGNGA